MMRSLLALAAVLALAAACTRSPTRDPEPPPAAGPAPKVGTAIGDRVAFTAQLADLSGAAPAYRELDAAAAGRPIAYLVLGTTCPSTAAYMPRIAELERRYHGDRLGFVYLYPNRTDSNDEKAAFHRRHGLRAPLVDDKGAVIASALGATRTSEVILVDERAVIRYRGAIDDARDEAAVVERHAATAIDALLAGRPIAVTATNVDA